MKAQLGLITTISLLMPLAAAPAQADDSKQEGADIIQHSTAVLTEYFSSPRMLAVRNLMGAVRAVYIAPALKQGGLIVGGTAGAGILLRRHGRDWSDPVFLEAKSLNVGLQAGLAELQFVSLIMTDEGVEALIAGDSRMSSGGGATLGTLGITGGGAGGVSGGVESITFAFSTGAFFGGNVGTTSLSLLPELNQAAYGSGFSQASVLSSRGGKLAEANKIRALLGAAVKESWDE